MLKRGRPKREEKVVKEEEWLSERLEKCVEVYLEVEGGGCVKEEKVDGGAGVSPAKEAKKAEALAAKERKKAEALALKEAKKAEALAAKETKKAEALAAKESKKAEKEAKKAEKKAVGGGAGVSPAAVVSPAEEVVKSPPRGELEEEEIDEDGGAGVPPAEEIDEDGGAGVPPAEEIEVHVKRFEHNGKKWYRDNNGVIYDIESQEEVGVWIEEKKCIEMIG